MAHILTRFRPAEMLAPARRFGDRVRPSASSHLHGLYAACMKLQTMSVRLSAMACTTSGSCGRLRRARIGLGWVGIDVQARVQLRSGSGIVPAPRTICRVSRRQLIHVPIDGLELHRTLGPCGKETASQRSKRHTTSLTTSPPSESRDHPPRTPDRPAHTTMTGASCEPRGSGRIEPGQRLA
jgi:hypothetical protein